MGLNTERNSLNTDDLLDRIISEIQSDREQRRQTSLLLEQNTLRFGEIAKELPRIEKNLDSINEKLERMDKENGIIRSELTSIASAVQYHSKLLHLYDGSNKPIILRMENLEQAEKELSEKFNGYIKDQQKEDEAKEKKIDRQINIKLAILAIAVTLILWLADRLFK